MDASDVGLEAVLLQPDVTRREQVIAYGSRLLFKPKRRHCVTRQELLAVVFFVYGCKFILVTDNGSHQWLLMTSKTQKANLQGGWSNFRNMGLKLYIVGDGSTQMRTHCHACHFLM